MLLLVYVHMIPDMECKYPFHVGEFLLNSKYLIANTVWHCPLFSPPSVELQH